MNSPLELRKVIWSVILTTVWVAIIVLIKPTLVIDWVGNGSVLTSLQLFVIIFGLLVIVLYHIFYQASAETTKLSLTAALTIVWLALILFYPFKDLAVDEGNRGAMGFFTLIGGLAVTVLWVRFFSDEIVSG